MLGEGEGLKRKRREERRGLEPPPDSLASCSAALMECLVCSEEAYGSLYPNVFILHANRNIYAGFSRRDPTPSLLYPLRSAIQELVLCVPASNGRHFLFHYNSRESKQSHSNCPVFKSTGNCVHNANPFTATTRRTSYIERKKEKQSIIADSLINL